MSYCRFGWDGSQVYVFGTVLNEVEGFECCGCRLMPGGVFVDSEVLMVNHLLEHRKAGHTVPQEAIDRLLYEAGALVDPPKQDSFLDVMQRNPHMFGRTQEEMDRVVADVRARESADD